MKKISIGTAQFGLKYGIKNNYKKFSQNKVNKIIDYCLKKNIFCLDTSQSYGDAEQKIGSYIRKKKIKLNITTKISYKKFNSIKKSIQNLNCIPEVILFHNCRDLFNKSFREKIFRECEHYGIKKIGVSIYKGDEINKILNFKKINVVQLPLNIIDRHFLENNTIKKLKRKKIEIQIRSVFLQGLLLIKKKKFIKNNYLFEKSINILEKIAKNNNIRISELCLRWVSLNKDIDRIVVGIDNISQLKQNIKILNKKKKLKSHELIKKIQFRNIKILDPRNWQ